MPGPSWSDRRKERANRIKKAAKQSAELTKVEEMVVFLVAHDGMEAIAASLVPGVGAAALIASRPDEVGFMTQLARRCADGTGRPIQVVKFARGETVDVIQPDPVGNAKTRVRQVLAEEFGKHERLSASVEPLAGAAPEDLPGEIKGQLKMQVVRDGAYAKLVLGDADGLVIPPATARYIAERLLSIASEIEGTTTHVMYGALEKGD